MTRSLSKLTIQLEEEYPFLVFGISAATSDYKLCWSLNRALKIGLKHQAPLEIYRKDREVSEHSFYTFEDESKLCKYRVIQNRSGNSVFLHELPRVDFLFVTDQSPAIDQYEVLQKIREIRHVLLVTHLDLDQLKQKQNLLLST